MGKLSGEIQKKIIFWGSVLGLMGILALLIAVARYNFMSADDYSYVINSVDDWRTNHSVLNVLSRQFGYAYNYYFTWQGTFAAEWLGSSLMVMICEDYYWLGTVIMLVAMVASEGLLLMLIGMKGLGGDFYSSGIVTCWCIALQIMMVQYPAEAFFWLCGSMLYTLGFSLAALLYAFVFLYISNSSKERRRKKVADILLQIGIILLSAIIGLGNYVSAIFILSSYILLMLWIWIGEKLLKLPPRSSKCRWVLSADALFFLIAFLFNVLAPGNRLRMANAGSEGVPVFKALVMSIYEAAKYLCINVHFPIVIIMIIMVPFMVRILEARKFRYPLPALFSLITFGLFASQFFPTMYTIGIPGAGRILNLYRFTTYLWLFGNELYWIGYVLRRIREAQEVSVDFVSKKKSFLLPICMMEVAVLAFGFIFWGGMTLTPVSAYYALRSGQAAQYRQEYEERLDIILNSTDEDIYLEPFSAPPYLLSFADIKEDPNSWENRDMAEYYGKKTIRLKAK